MDFHLWPALLLDMQALIRSNMCESVRFMMSLTARGEVRHLPTGAWPACWEAACHDWRKVALGYRGEKTLGISSLHYAMLRVLWAGDERHAIWLCRVAAPRLFSPSVRFEHWFLSYAGAIAHSSAFAFAALICRDYVRKARAALADYRSRPAPADGEEKRMAKRPYTDARAHLHEFAWWLTDSALAQSNVALAHWLQDRKLWCNHAPILDPHRCPIHRVPFA